MITKAKTHFYRIIIDKLSKPTLYNTGSMLVSESTKSPPTADPRACQDPCSDDQLDHEAELRAKLIRPTDVKNISLKLAGETPPQRIRRGYYRFMVAYFTGARPAK